jgi:hypothetical protein
MALQQKAAQNQPIPQQVYSLRAPPAPPVLLPPLNAEAHPWPRSAEPSAQSQASTAAARARPSSPTRKTRPEP